MPALCDPSANLERKKEKLFSAFRAQANSFPRQTTHSPTVVNISNSGTMSGDILQRRVTFLFKRSGGRC